MNKKGFANIVLIILVVILAGTTGYFALRKPTTEPPSSPIVTESNNDQQTYPATSPSVNSNQTPPAQTINQGWEKYTDSRLEFEYPPIVSAKLSGETITLNHSITYRHNSDYQTYLNLPGVISPTQEEEFFAKVLLSLKVK